VGEVANPRITAVLHQNIARAHCHATQRLGDRKIGEAAACRLIARVQPPVAAFAAGDRDGRTIHQIELQTTIRRRIASTIREQPVRHVSQKITRIAQSIQQGDVAEIGDTGFDRVAGDRA
jgi:hypothetical protein